MTTTAIYNDGKNNCQIDFHGKIEDAIEDWMREMSSRKAVWSRLCCAKTGELLASLREGSLIVHGKGKWKTESLGSQLERLQVKMAEASETIDGDQMAQRIEGDLSRIMNSAWLNLHDLVSRHK